MGTTKRRMLPAAIVAVALMGGAVALDALQSGTAASRADGSAPSQAGCQPRVGLLEGFTTPDGALRTYSAQDSGVDPYFATKALLVARRGGLCIADVAGRWVKWLLPTQLPDARFERYCQEGPSWRPCRPADADDALAAVWIELLGALEEDGRVLDAAEGRSLAASERMLDGLYRPDGRYRVSTALDVALLMDNVEVLSAKRSLARRAWRQGRWLEGIRRAFEVFWLDDAIAKGFWDAQHSEYRASSQDQNRDTFYPYATAQLFPLLVPLRTGPPAHSVVDRFLGKHGRAWIEGRADVYPWALAATVLFEQGYGNEVQAWLGAALSARSEGRWTVLDEAAFQAVLVPATCPLSVPTP